MPAGPHLLRTYDLTPYGADMRADFEARTRARITSGTWLVQADPAIDAWVLFVMDDAPAGAVLALDAIFAGYDAAG
jgi:hypothetical protein